MSLDNETFGVTKQNPDLGWERFAAFSQKQRVGRVALSLQG